MIRFDPADRSKRSARLRGIAANDLEITRPGATIGRWLAMPDAKNFGGVDSRLAIVGQHHRRLRAGKPVANHGVRPPPP